MSARGKGSGMSTQGSVTIPRYETPVLAFDVMEDTTLIASVVNFLRSGCPGVQILFPVGNLLTHISGGKHISIKLANLALDKEKFSTKWTLRHDSGSVLTITRSIEPETVNTNFSNLDYGDRFLDADGKVCIRLNKDNLFCWISGSRNGQIKSLSPDTVVKHIKST
jgi:hypothetical protein